MECRKKITKLAASALTLFAAAKADFCNSDQRDDFQSPEGICYYILRTCITGELAGGKHYDAAMKKFPATCNVNSNRTYDCDRFDSLATWREGNVDLQREINADVNMSKIFEQCIKGVFNHAEELDGRDRRLGDTITGAVAIVLLCIAGLILLTCFIGCIVQRDTKPKVTPKDIPKDVSKKLEKVVVESNSSTISHDDSNSSSSTLSRSYSS